MLSRHLAHFFKGSWNECYVQTLTQSCNTEREEAKHTANQYNNQHSQTFQYNSKRANKKWKMEKKNPRLSY